jgi:hypothetical protein
MRCKPGDLAYLVRPEIATNLGILVEVLKADRRPAHWLVRSLSGERPANDGTLRLEAVAEDSALRPIVPPERSRRGKLLRHVGAEQATA